MLELPARTPLRPFKRARSDQNRSRVRTAIRAGFGRLRARWTYPPPPARKAQGGGGCGVGGGGVGGGWGGGGGRAPVPTAPRSAPGRRDLRAMKSPRSDRRHLLSRPAHPHPRHAKPPGGLVVVRARRSRRARDGAARPAGRPVGRVRGRKLPQRTALTSRPRRAQAGPVPSGQASSSRLSGVPCPVRAGPWVPRRSSGRRRCASPPGRAPLLLARLRGIVPHIISIGIRRA